MSIHPTAIVDSNARLDSSVEVGPYSIIEGDVEIGAGTVISSGVRIYSGTVIGQNNRIYHNAVLGTQPQSIGFDPATRTRLIIGDANEIREGVNISRSMKPDAPTRIGSHNYMMGNFHIGHDAVMGDHNTFVQGCVIGGHVELGNRITVAGLVAVHQFVRIGDFAMLGGLAKVTMDVPPYCTVDGNPALVIGQNSIGLRRNGFSKEQRAAVKQAYKIVYHSGLLTSDAVKRLKELEQTPEVAYITRFIDESERGILDHWTAEMDGN